MTAVAYDNHERRIVESYAHASLLLAAHLLPVELTDACHADGMRSATYRSGDARVQFTYPIWFAADGTEVSYQIDVRYPDGSTVTMMTGLTAEVPRGYLVRLLAIATDPAGLASLCGAARTGSDEVACVLGIRA